MRNKMIPYNLYVSVTNINDIGQEVKDWELVKEINVRVEFNSMSKASDDIRYIDCQYIGVSDYKGLDLSKEYKIEKQGISYLIKSINEWSRYSFYLLERVI